MVEQAAKNFLDAMKAEKKAAEQAVTEVKKKVD
jgi:hypothetical protein